MSRSLVTAIVVVAAIGLWLASGVEPSEVARYLGYELAFVVAPGVLLLGAISPGTRGLARLALGWPLGLVCEIAFFSLGPVNQLVPIHACRPTLGHGGGRVIYLFRGFDFVFPFDI